MILSLVEPRQRRVLNLSGLRTALSAPEPNVAMSERTKRTPYCTIRPHAWGATFFGFFSSYAGFLASCPSAGDSAVRLRAALAPVEEP